MSVFAICLQSFKNKMIANKLKKISGTIRIRISKSDFESKLFTTEYVYTGCLCLNSANSNYVYTHYIPGVIDANFITYKEINSKFSNKEINWEETNKLELKDLIEQNANMPNEFFTSKL